MLHVDEPEYHKDERFIYEIGTLSGFRRAFSFDRGQARERLRSGEWQEVGSGRLLIAGLYGASLPFGGAGWWPMSLLVGDLNPDYPSLQRFSPSSALEIPTVAGTHAIRLTGKLRSGDATVDVRQSDHAILGVRLSCQLCSGGGKGEYVPLFDSCAGSRPRRQVAGAHERYDCERALCVMRRRSRPFVRCAASTANEQLERSRSAPSVSIWRGGVPLSFMLAANLDTARW